MGSIDLGQIGAVILVVIGIFGAIPAVLFAVVALLKVIPGDQGESTLEAIANTLQKLVNAIPKK